MAAIVTQMTTLFNFVFNAETGIAGTFISWLTASGHEIVLVGLILYVLVALFGMVTRLIPGVR